MSDSRLDKRVWWAFACEVLALIAACSELFGRDLEVSDVPFFLAFGLDAVALVLTSGISKHPDADETVRKRAKLATVLAVTGMALIPVVYIITAFGAGLAGAGR